MLGLELHDDLAGLGAEFEHELALTDEVGCLFEIGGRELEEAAFAHAAVEIVQEHSFAFDLQESFGFEFVESRAVELLIVHYINYYFTIRTSN